MNRLKLNRVRDALKGDRIQFWIDERPFERILVQLQLEDGEYLPRDGWRPPQELLGELANDVADLELRFDLSERVDRLDQLNHASLLLCACGEEGCWCVWCSVEIGSQSVAWRNLKSGPFLRDNSIVLEIEFVFDRKQYVDEFVRFCTEGAPKPRSGLAGVVDAGFSHDGLDFFVLTNEFQYLWNLKDGSYERRVDAADQDDEIFLSGSTDPENPWRASVHDEATVHIVRARTDELLIELRFDAVNARWLALDREGLFEIHGSLSYPVAIPTVFGRSIADRGPDNLRKGLLAATLSFDRHRKPALNSEAGSRPHDNTVN